ncbi:hypothetical protein [Teredinibacter turnerae]|uniref:hypothetical protein n=1 Tax=Teredinibacter turnerae TaxID=2426 RepID=UPI0003814640|nr:hypothetical protein [Teredinibacter turnerae]
MKKKLLVQLVLVSMVAAVGPAFSEPAEEPIVKLITQMADTPADHKALSAYYTAKAEQALEELELHRSMKKTYGKRHAAASKGVDYGASMGRHCDSLIDSFQRAAKDYQALAELHMQQAMGH